MTASANQKVAYEKVLSPTLGRVIDFVKFAEAKNAALLTFASAWILASINAISDTRISQDWRSTLIVTLPFFAISAVLAIISFLPKINLDKLHKDPGSGKSLLFFGHAAEFEPAAYKERLQERYLPPEGEGVTQSYLDDLAVQININSSRASSKFKLFNWGALSVLLAITILGGKSFIGLLKFIW